MPVHGDEREQTMLNLVPLAGVRREVADLNLQARLLGEPTQLKLPQVHPMFIAAATVGSNDDEQLFGVRAEPPC